ncbi:MAG: hypothetical protein PHI63_05940 [Patescibacteria group bacterium]|nr:hypothetical protein [Patescibacteria group bacterium]
MPAKKGNQYNLKFKTPAERQALCHAWCNHLAEGFSKESFPQCDPQTFRSYVEKFPKDFDTQKIEAAERSGQLVWEKIAMSLALGAKGNAAVLIATMKNRFGWRDKVDITSNGKTLHTIEQKTRQIAEGIAKHPHVQLPQSADVGAGAQPV